MQPLRRLFFAVLAGAAGSAAAEQPVTIDLTAPPGRYVEVQAHRIYLHCVGAGAPTVVIDSGIGGSSLEWYSIQETLAREMRVCAWDRSGYGWSDTGPSPRTTDQVVSELHELLTLAGEAPPYLLVGHSFGGFTARYFAASHPAETAGLVLVDSSHPDQGIDIAVGAAAGRAGPVNPIKAMDAEKYHQLPAGLLEQASFLNSRRKAVFTQMDEIRHFQDSAKLVADAGPLPDVPLVVVMRGLRAWPEGTEGDAKEAAWSRTQADLATLTPRGELRVARASGHNVHLDEPGLVMDAIRSVARQARTGVVTGTGAPAS